jgi:RNase P subunit RPR2
VQSREPQFCVASNEIKNQHCVKCQAPMVLTRVNTARLSFDVRTFECFNCDNVDKVMTETRREPTLWP